MPQKIVENLYRQYGIHINAMILDIQRYLPELNEEKFKDAFYFAALAHNGQLRKENKPYIIHPVETVKILISMHADEDTLIAAFLHDVPEDTNHTIEEIGGRFGKKVAFLVEGITKLSKVHFRNDMAERQIESLKKLFIHSAEDPRIILIKLADRLHNMRTLQYIEKPEKRLRIARETLEIFVPIANLLGIEELKSELENLCFFYIYPAEYENISKRMQTSKEKNKQFLEETITIVQKELDKAKISAVTYGRQKSFYSIYKKIIVQGKLLNEVDDLIGLRILVPERDDCYRVLGILHNIFKPKPSKFKDYIAVPKFNGYQSLHTTVFCPNGVVAEFQVRTNQMHLEAEYGIASHYFYEQQKHKDLGKEKYSYWVNKVLEMQKQKANVDSFIEDLKLDIFQDRIFVFTPKGDPIDLPKDATCIDFAYNIHTHIGHKAVQADVNGEILPLTTILRTGDTVRIIISEEQIKPDRKWLSFVKTNIAKHSIKQYFKQESKEAKISLGEELLQKEFTLAGFGSLKDISNKKLNRFFEKYPDLSCNKKDDILIAIGEGEINPMELVNFLHDKNHNENLKKDLKQIKVGIKISFKEDRPKLLKNLTTIISNFGINIINIKSFNSFFTGLPIVNVVLNVGNYKQLSELFQYLETMEGVKKVERNFWKRKTALIILTLFTFTLWSAHPFIMYFVINNIMTSNPIFINVFQYLSLLMLFFIIYALKNLTNKSFPELKETNTLWIMTLVLNIFAFFTFFIEMFIFKIELNGLIAGAISLTIFVYLGLEYRNYQKNLPKV